MCPKNVFMIMIESLIPHITRSNSLKKMLPSILLLIFNLYILKFNSGYNRNLLSPQTQV